MILQGRFPADNDALYGPTRHQALVDTVEVGNHTPSIAWASKSEEAVLVELMNEGSFSGRSVARLDMQTRRAYNSDTT